MIDTVQCFDGNSKATAFFYEFTLERQSLPFSPSSGRRESEVEMKSLRGIQIQKGIFGVSLTSRYHSCLHFVFLAVQRIRHCICVFLLGS
jgi:hypothetical protein